MADPFADVETHSLYEFDEEERLPCSWNYVVLCVLLPLLNGQLHALLFPAYTLHFDDLGWPIVRAGLAVTVGFLLCVVVQQMVVLHGYWLIVPLSIVHLAFAVLSYIYTESEWAVFAQLVAVFGIDPTCALEGIAFDAFGSSDSQAAQASSTTLSVYTIAVALSCTTGGILYDFAGWKGVSAYHMVCQGLLVLTLCAHPACRSSFREVFFPAEDDFEESDVYPIDFGEAQKESRDSRVSSKLSAVVPGAGDARASQEVSRSSMAPALPGIIEEVTEVDKETEPSAGTGGEAATENVEADIVADRRSKISVASKDSKTELDTKAPDRQSQAPDRKSQAPDRRSHAAGSRAKSRVGNGRATMTSVGGRATLTSAFGTRATRLTQGTVSTPRHPRGTARTGLTGFTAFTGFTGFTRGSGGSALSGLSRMTDLSHAGQDFAYHFGTSNVLQPKIAGATGRKSIVRLRLSSYDDDLPLKPESKVPAEFSRDLWLPAFLLALNAAYSNAAYVIEYATFAIYYKQVHKWQWATWAAVAQTAGDVVAAVALQALPVCCCPRYDEEAAGKWRRRWHHIWSHPYCISVVLIFWILFNCGMATPWLPLALTVQVFMGTTFVYSAKWSSEMMGFYSLGNPEVFLRLQILCRNAEALGGGFGGLLATWLYTLDKMGPFVFTTSLAGVIFLLYTLGFWLRVGFGEDLEIAEQKRAVRKGIKRVPRWRAQQETQDLSWATETALQ